MPIFHPLQKICLKYKELLEFFWAVIIYQLLNKRKYSGELLNLLFWEF